MLVPLRMLFVTAVLLVPTALAHQDRTDLTIPSNPVRYVDLVQGTGEFRNNEGWAALILWEETNAVEGLQRLTHIHDATGRNCVWEPILPPGCRWIPNDEWVLIL